MRIAFVELLTWQTESVCRGTGYDQSDLVITLGRKVRVNAFQEYM